MGARLVGISGPAAGTSFDMGEAAAVSVGRTGENDWRIEDPTVSGKHCRIERQGDEFLIRDLGSYKGTHVNGESVTAQALHDGDRIRLGRSVLVFATSDSAAIPPTDALVVFEEEAVTTALRVGAAEATYSNAEALPKLPASARAAHDLAILLSIATRIGTIHDESSLLWQLLGMIFEVVPAERGAIVLAGKGAEFVSSVAWNRTGARVDNVPVIRTVLRQAYEERSGVLVHSVATDERLRKSQSASGSQAHSVLCAPMVAGSRILGMIYVDVVNLRIQFSDAHLQIAMGIASIASLALETVRNAANLRMENDRLKEDLDLQHKLIGDSAAMRGLRQLITRVAAADTTVLICGESGTGKELVARSIHDESDRSRGPFVAINCAALTESLLETELFGHEKGAFTGALAQKRGHIEIANGGTLFLDEVGEFAGALQAKLLRALQEREIVRVGGTRPIKVDVRVLAATNRDLGAAAAAGSFRQDLYYRLNVVRIEVPPLRAHCDDIAVLAEHFLERYHRKCKRRVCGISPQAMQAFTVYDWPGNVRELENAIEQAVVLGSSDDILLEDLPEALLERAAARAALVPESYHDALLAFKKQLILSAIAKSDGTLAHAARLLGLHPNYLHRLVTNLELRTALKKTV